MIRQVLSDTARVGVEVDVKVKRLEIWLENPSYFDSSEKEHDIETHLYSFCESSPEDKLDHKMMYTWDSDRVTVGIAFVGGVCIPKWKCSIVIPDKNSVATDLHELGHNLGLLHDPEMPGCTLPNGFMGWKDTVEFKDCYRPVLLASLAKPSSQCLYSASGVTAQVLYKGQKLVAFDQSLSGVLNKW